MPEMVSELLKPSFKTDDVAKFTLTDPPPVKTAVSMPLPPIMVSTPSPPIRVSLPSPPSSVSSPASPRRMSSPNPPKTVSSPAPALKSSSPSRPSNKLSSVPVLTNVSSPNVPTRFSRLVKVSVKLLEGVSASVKLTLPLPLFTVALIAILVPAINE